MRYFVVAEPLVYNKEGYEWLKKHAQVIEKGKSDQKASKKIKSVTDFKFKVEDLFKK